MELMRRWISRRKPWVFENSKIPVWLSYVAPIEIFALSFGPFVFCRDELPDQTRTHETIHYHQQLELLFVFQWLLYVVFWVVGLVRHRSGSISYYENPFEIEAYNNDHDANYLEKRSLWAWRHYV
jgi:hypothetical protein